MKRHRVMVVEDDIEIRESLQEILEEHGYEVVGAAHGQLALQCLQGEKVLPCVILLDLMMPVLDGQGFREAQLQDPKLAHIPVLVLSAYRDIETNADALRAQGFIKKPPRIDELLAAVRQHC